MNLFRDRIEIVRYSADLLSEEHWTFVFFEDGLHETSGRPSLLLDRYEKLERANKRQKPKRVGFFERLSNRDTTVHQPPLPEDVTADARMRLIRGLTDNLYVGMPLGGSSE